MKCHQVRAVAHLPFSLKGGFKFLKTTCVEPYCPWRAIAFGDGGPKKNSENFDILQSHNQLSARYLRAQAISGLDLVGGDLIKNEKLIH